MGRSQKRESEMKFIDAQAVDELAKSPTILQMIVHSLDWECGLYQIQPELVGVNGNQALINCDPLRFEEINAVCERVNKLYKRRDRTITCHLQESSKTFVVCEAGALEVYSQVT
jgi:hypothetical protein